MEEIKNSTKRDEDNLKLTESFNRLANEILLLFNVNGSVCQCGSNKLHIDIKNKRIECGECKSGKWLINEL